MPGSSVVHVIDDDEALRESLAFLLGTAHLAVRTYESATAFLDALPRTDPGCIVTDVRMPGISGVELLRRLKNLEAAFPVIVITGHGDVPLAVEAMKLGAVDFLEKPFEDDALIAAVQSALGRHEHDARRAAEKAETFERIASLSAQNGSAGRAFERCVQHGGLTGALCATSMRPCPALRSCAIGRHFPTRAP